MEMQRHAQALGRRARLGARRGACHLAAPRPQTLRHTSCSSVRQEQHGSASRGDVRLRAASSTAPATITGQSVSGVRSEVAAAAKDDFSADKRPVILYDGVCNLCNGAVDFMLENDTRGNFRMAALQSEAGRRLLKRSGRRPDDISSIVLVEERGASIRSEAILKIAAGISQPWAFLAIFGFPVPGPLRDAVYDLVANNRYSFLGKREVCRLSNAGFEDRFIVD